MTMEILQKILLALIGFSGGFTVAAGVFALITMIGMIPRICARTSSGKYVRFYETMIVLGGTAGSVLTIYQIPFHIGWFGMAVYGVFSGVFVGCLSMALAESLRIIPIFSKRMRLSVGFPFLILALAIGKGLGTWYQLYFR